MTKRFLLFWSVAFIGYNALQAQSFAWGIKGGALIGTQKWESIQRDPLVAWHGETFIESLPEGNNFSLFAQGGYHIKGSAIRNFTVTLINGDEFQPPTQRFEFRNLSVVLGAKQKFDFKDISKAFYSFGLRADYTLSTNLDDYKQGNIYFPAFFPDNFFVRKFNYGVHVGGGFEIPLTELIDAFVDVSLNPDLSFQYRQPPIGNVSNPYNPGTTTSIPERKIVNVTLEISVGFRFLRIVEYVD